jgi:hypothetical protein
MATFTDATKNAANDARCATANGGYLRLFDAGRATLLVEFELANPAYGASVAGVATIAPVAVTTVLANGTIAEFAVFASDGTTERWGGTSVALTPGPAEVVIDGASLAVTTGLSCSLVAHTVTQP